MNAEQLKRPQHKSPYKFLDYYDPEDADLFFGRDREIRQLEQKFYNSRLIVLHGESGTGKTSLIRAGLIPRLSPEEYVPVYVRVLEEPLRAIQREMIHQLHLEGDRDQLTGESPDLEISLAPGTLHQRIKDFLGVLPNLADSPAQRAFVASAGLDPDLEKQLTFGLPPGQFVELLVSTLSKYGRLADGRQALAAVLEAAQQYVGQDRRIYCEKLRQAVQQQFPTFAQQSASVQPTNSLAEFLRQITARISKTVVIVLDQFEEFFLRFPEDVRRPFETELGACLVTSEPNIKVLISLRTDYFGKLAEFEDAIPQIFTHQLHLMHLTEAQALAAVIKPPQLMGMQIDEAMVQIKLLPELLSTTGGIEPPLLQIICDALYQNARNEDRNTIGMADYEAIGDVNGALRHYLDEKLRQFGQHQPQARAVLKALITSAGTKQAVFLSELAARISSAGVTLTNDELQRQYLDKFVNYRLVRVDEVEGRARYELSHDYLAKHIEAWIAESEREVTKILELIDRAYETYRATSVLLEKSALQMIKPFEEQLKLLPEKLAFVESSKTQVRKQRRSLWLKVAAALMVVALMVGGIFGYQAYQQYREALRQKELAIEKQQEAEDQRQKAEIERRNAEEQRQKAEQQTEIAQKNFQQAQLNEIEALNQTSKALFLTHDELGALLAAIKAGQKSIHADVSPKLRFQSFLRLHEVMLKGSKEHNRLEGHTADVFSIAFSPDGTQLASGSEDASIKLWRVADGQQLTTFRGHKGGVWSVAFSPDGKLLASGSADYTIKLWRVADGKELATFEGHKSMVWSVVFSPDGTRLATGSQDKTIKLWRVADGKLLATLHGHTGSVESVAFSPDGTQLASGSDDNTIKVWQVVNNVKQLATFQGHTDKVWSVAFSPDGMRLASGSDDKTIKLWQVADGKELTTLRHTANVRSVVFSPDGMQLASTNGSYSDDYIIKLWSVTDGAEIDSFQWPVRGLYQVAFSPDGAQLAVATGNNTIELWRLWGAADTDAIKFGTSQEFQGHTEDVISIAFSPDGKLLASGSGDNTVKIWRVADGVKLVDFQAHTRSVLSVAFSPDGTQLVSSCWYPRSGEKWDPPIKLWQVDDGAALIAFDDHGSFEVGSAVNSVAFSPDGTLLASANDYSIKFWRITDGTELATFPGYNHAVFSPDGTLLASGGGDNTIKLWRVADGTELATFQEHANWIRSMAFSPDGTLLASGGNDTTIKLWRVPDGAELATLRGHTEEVFSVAFSPDGTLLASGSWDDTIKLWSIPDGEELATFRMGSSVWSVAFSPDGTKLAGSSSGAVITIWNLEWDLNNLLVRECKLLQGYLKNNLNVSDADRTVCDEILQNDRD